MSDSTRTAHKVKPVAPKSAVADTDTSEICIHSDGFDPPSVAVKVGQVVTWKNEDSAPHSITFANPGVVQKELDITKLGVGGESSKPPAPTVPNETGVQNLAPQATFTKSFGTPGTYNYHCDNNPSMSGSVTVAAA